MKCKKCGFEWQPHGERLACPSCGISAALTHSEQQAIWEEAYAAQKIKDHTLYADSLLRLAEQGDRKAEFAYAECLAKGIGVPADAEEALLWYKAAAGKMHPTAAYRLAECLKDKRFGNNQTQVLFWMRVAAEFGDSQAAYALSRMYQTGDGVPASPRHALYFLSRSAKGGYERAVTELAKMYAVGDGVEKDLAAARYLLASIPSPSVLQRLALHKLGKGERTAPKEIERPSPFERLELGRRAEAEAEYAIAAYIYYLDAKKGDAEANYLLGSCYEKGNGVPKSESEARRRYELAARAGNANAAVRLGTLAKDGVGGEQSNEYALSCYLKAAEAGNAEAAFLLAEIYRNGTLTEASLPRALHYYEKAAKGGHEAAKDEAEKIKQAVSAIYEKGLAAQTEQNLPEALRFFTLAAGMGHAGAAYLLGSMYENGRACPKNDKKAVSYYRTAAEQGNLGAIYRLGVCYSEGRGVRCDYAVAGKLLGVCAKQNYENAQAILDELRRRKHKKAGQKVYSISSVLYRRGEVDEAIRFRTIAAKLGNARAMYILGCHFEFGDGLPMDRAKAAAWYTRAARAGFTVRAGSDLKGGFLREKKQLMLRRKGK